MMKVTRMIYLTFAFAICVCQLGLGQSTTNLVRDKVVKNENYSFSLESKNLPIPDYGSEYSNVSQISYVDPIESPYTLIASFTPDFLGTAHFAIKWLKGTDSFPFFEPRITFYEIEIVESIIETELDVISIEEGVSTVEIYPLANDYGNNAPLSLVGISQVMYGSAEVTDSNTIIYTPSADQSELDYIVYTVSDTIAEYASGNIIINTIDPNPIASDTLHYTITDVQSQVIVFPIADMDVVVEPNQGAVDSLSMYAYRYIPELGATGVDSISFDDGQGTTRVTIVQVISISDDPSYAVDDKVYTPKNTTVTIQPFENDIANNYPIINISEELDYVSPGVYTFTPEEDFEGVKVFEYTIDYGVGEATAQIYVQVSNYEPQNTFAYNFKTPKGQPLVIKYEVPLDSYEFGPSGFISTPHGLLTAYGENDNVTVGCNDVNGEAFFIYYPDLGYVGTDSFTIDYCTEDECINYTVAVEMIEVESAACYCVNDCVWEGDTDGNGKVNVADLLPIGRHMGAAGNSRESVYEFWSAEDTDDWTYFQPNGKNIKHADANGDGIVTVADTNSISEYYNQLNNFVPEQVLAIKNYPFYLVPHTTEVDSGDLLVMDIVLGTGAYPVKDMHGLSFAIQVNGGFADSSSMYLDFFEDGWLTQLGPSIQMSQKPADGLIEAALSRTDGIPASGYGIIGELGFIIEDEAEGFKDDDGEVFFSVKLVGASGETAGGSSYYMPEAGVRIQYINEGNKEELPIVAKDMLISPNPTSDKLSIELPNADEVINNVYLTDITGRSITVNRSNTIIDVSGLPVGIYILSVESTVNTYTKKVQVIR